MSAEDLQHLLSAIAPDSKGLVVLSVVLLYVVRVALKELREWRAERASTSTVGRRLGELETALAAQGWYVPGKTSAAALPAPKDPPPADDDDLAGWPPRDPVPPAPVPPVPVPPAFVDEDLVDDDQTEQRRIPVPAIPAYPRHRRQAANREAY